MIEERKSEKYGAILTGKIVTDISVDLCRENEWTNEGKWAGAKSFHRNEFHNQNALHYTFRINYSECQKKKFSLHFSSFSCAVPFVSGATPNTIHGNFFSLQPSDTQSIIYSSKPPQKSLCVHQNRIRHDLINHHFVRKSFRMRINVCECVSMYT